MAIPLSQSISRWPAPAKINLFLHITGRLANGYHQLQSLFQLLDTGDEIGIEITSGTDIELMTPIEGVAYDDNLIVKAAKLLQEHGKPDKGCRIWLDKKLPMGGGIGGGSSNAATTLLALNTLWDIHLPLSELAALGLTLGADVPIFVEGNTAFAEGVGEHLTPVETSEKIYLLACPPVHVSTAEIFKHPDLPRNTPRIDWQQYSFENSHNDCQDLVCGLYPDVANTLHRLLEYAPSRMTGTGACLFAIFDDIATAKQAQSELANIVPCLVTKGINRSPVHTLLQSYKV